jgi:acetyltransferase-like isoleucine patch superfamily enzyme
MTVKGALKSLVNVIALVCMFPLAALSIFGRIAPVFQLGAQTVALVPGMPGDYLRAAYYFMTLRESCLSIRISFGTFFAQSASRVARDVYIGAYCVLGKCDIGKRSQIASHVQILSGSRQHARDEHGRITGAQEDLFSSVSVGEDCWIGASAIIMADIGSGTTIGAGAVVPHPVPSNVVAVGNPARILQAKRDVGCESLSLRSNSTLERQCELS